ncbi:disulfide bond formation protein B [Chitinasiproducens palmae]|uniref:Disulfide bond formation protein B n=1 Tax=Chitinasiproducens palmae TaxID=1770053 RepID=A0A1H2PW30_9BURK|nr:disulfide bond formation protein B [Chitinasiproducens palmae]SDV51110.1 Thiol:disulfide interchange protein DsbB [Chitinasiproducens palmae]
MPSTSFRLTDPKPRDAHLYALLGIVCVALVAGAVYLQLAKGEDPCPLCIMQRYAFLLIAIFAFATAASRAGGVRIAFKVLTLLSALAGIGIAARHVWVQSHPSFSCGFDTLQPLVDGLPPAQWLPTLFRTAGLCETLYPPLLGLSLPTWSLIAFVVAAAAVLSNLLARRRAGAMRA